MRSWALQSNWDHQVLLLEDDPEVAETLKSFLKDLSCHVTRVSNGLDGVKALLWSDFSFVVCDLTIPGLPYQGLYKAAVRLKPKLCDRFLFISGHAADPAVDIFIRRIRALTLWEPFDQFDFTAAVRMMLRKVAANGGDHSHSPGMAFALSSEFELASQINRPVGAGIAGASLHRVH